MTTSPAPSGVSPDTKALVDKGYNHMAQSYLSWSLTAPSRRQHYLSHLLSHLPSNSTVLELGCGAGVPILETLIHHPSCAKVYANDLSSAQISLAKERCPSAVFYPGDMMALEFEEGSLDGVVAFYSIFHLPRAEQRVMKGKVAGWLKSGGGMVVMNLGTTDEEVIQGEFFGQEMFWSSFDVETSKAMVEEVGLEVVKAEVVGDENLKDGDPDYGLRFLWLVLRKP